MQLVAAFVGIAILLAIGIQILGNAVQDCTSLPGNATSGWQGQCESGQTQTIDAYGLLGIVPIVIAAVAILFVVKML